MLTKVLFAFTRSSYVRFVYAIKKSDIFRRSFGFEPHFLPQKIFRGRPGDLFFSSPGAPETNLYFLLALASILSTYINYEKLQ